ncbi:MAG TPA: Sjogren's syndrome/scleroderma autoantigen 1 family protein [Methanomicrobiales archaeon]|nr:Sjogren's syndrome/scleroderma autoantigen 1 family protein [Methanomicrobiales archaeon]
MGEKKPRNPDDIMAECLLRGGKMLPKACRACGSPLFEVKGETLCVVCREQGKPKETGTGAAAPGAASPAPADREIPAAPGAGAQVPGGETDEERELRLAIAILARRAREETDPDRCLALMEAARNGALALSFLQR